jgi:hypothetical protein
MKKIFLTLTAVILLTSCISEEPALAPFEYTIVDTTHIARNGFNMVLCYDVILLNHYDSMYHFGSIGLGGKLIDYNPRPLKLK